MTHLRPATVLAASVLALAGCATEPAAEPGLSPSPTSGVETTTQPGLLTYPDVPTTLWEFSALEADLSFGPDVALVDPSQITTFVEGAVSASPIDAGDVWVVAAQGSSATAVLIGLSPTLGEPIWTYRPETGVLSNCARSPQDDELACVVSNGESGAQARSAVVLLDLATGERVGGFDLPFPAHGVEVAGTDLIALMLTDPGLVSDEDVDLSPTPYQLARFGADGEQRWATDLAVDLSGPGRSLWESVRAGDSLVGVELHGTAHVLALADGELLAERSGGDWAWIPTASAGLLVDWSTPEGGDASVLAADGSVLATLPGHRAVSALVPDAGAPPLLLDAEGEVVEVDVASGSTTPTGAVPGDGTGVDAASVIGSTLVATTADAMLGYDLDAPSAPPWGLPLLGAPRALTDGTTLYVTGLATPGEGQDGDGPAEARAVAAVGLADGAVAWTLPVTASQAGGTATVERVGQYLAVVDGPRLTVLAP